MVLRLIKTFTEWTVYIIWGVNLIDFIALQGIGHIQRIFPSVNSDMTTVATFLGIAYFILTGWMKFDKHKTDKLQQLQTIRQLEISNHAKENENFVLRQAIKDNLTIEQIKESEERLKR